MLAIKRIPNDNPECSPLLIRTAQEKPLFYQILASDSDHLERAIEKLESLGADGIDLNLGCSAPMIRKQGGGASLARNKYEMCVVLKTMRRKTELPLSVKIRIGDNENAGQLLDFCNLLTDTGVDLITIHARLNGEKFCRKPRWSIIGEVKHKITVPVFVNGGIFSVADASLCLKVTDADGLMIGRGAAEKPWLGGQIAKKIYGLSLPEEQRSLAEIFFRFTVLLEERFAPERQLGRLKQFASYFAPPLPYGHHFASAVQTSKTMTDAKERASHFFDQLVLKPDWRER
jgi:tRNA-dihydrouridine synthase